ncbi:unnamed protein product [Phytophthora lilii]|uniref:Unnamed protein product n=1 Tax=Phytophthora lilii TaxID=2077276 RepID=A0A9W6XHU9_9STRA|nr:unnamed protein product [Phytophthora lilii]
MQLFAPILVIFALFASGSATQSKSGEEIKSFDELYTDAVTEGGNLVLYHGGDTPTSLNTLHDAFVKRFPKINFTAIVDYSKQNVTASTTPSKEVTATRSQPGFPKYIYSFSFLYNTTALNGLAPPTTAADLVDPKYAGKIASSYPHDDDAVLFLYTRYVEKYGWDWVAKLAQQNVSFNAVQTWGKRVGILSKAKNPVAAKLFMNWIISEEAQTTLVSNSVRTDINANKPWDVPEANMAAFPPFMEDRAKVEQWKQTFALYFGEVQGKPTPGWLGLYPGKQ